MKKVLLTIVLICSFGLIVFNIARADNVIDPYVSPSTYESYVIDLVAELQTYTVAVKHDSGHGSGMVFRKESTEVEGEFLYSVITNYHVINGGENVNVYYSDVKQYPAIDYFFNATRDIAVIRFKTTDVLPFKRVQQIEDNRGIELKAGQTVIAIGSPQDINKHNYVTLGVLSLVSFPYNMLVDLAFMHDADINPGNSGGPLFNLNGDLIGINVAKISSIPGENGAVSADGLGYALNMNIIGPFLNAVNNSQYQPFVRAARLGVTIMNISDFMNNAGDLGLDTHLLPQGYVNGVVIVGIDPTRDAHGKLFVYDIIIACDGFNVNDRNDLASRIGGGSIGDIHAIRVVRVVGGINNIIEINVRLS